MNLIFCCAVLAVLAVFGCVFCPLAHAGGGGGGKGGIGKSAPKAPKVQALPEPEPLPDTTPVEAESAAVREDERRKLLRRRGAAGTALAPLGSLGTGGTEQTGPGLLGRMG